MKPAYYNEIDPKKAAWLRELIARNLVAPGDVDERSIIDVRPADLRGYRQCHFFAGIGIWSYALRLAGWPDSREVWTGSCPCPSFSAAGKGQGFDDPRHLWPAWFGLIRECNPPVCFGEQVDDAIGHGWLDLVQTDLEGKAYAVGKAVLGACSVGAPHIRQRLYFCADTAGAGCERRRAGEARDERNAPRIELERFRDALSGPESLHSERRPLLFDGSDGRNGQDGGRQEAHGIAGARGEVRERADADGRRPSNGDVQRSGQQRLLAEDCRTGEPFVSDKPGLEIRIGAAELRQAELSTERRGEVGDLRDSPERGQPVCGSPSGIAGYASLTGATRGFWRDCDWWYGKDGKYRPIERGLLPLAHGTPARVLRLRGYGDGIVAQAAAAFVSAYMGIDSARVGSEHPLGK